MTYAKETSMEFSCGVTLWHSFGRADGWCDRHIHQITRPEGGAGIHCALFIVGDAACDAAFKELCTKYKLRYKTRVRKNRNSGNKVYFAVFEQSSKEAYGWEDD